MDLDNADEDGQSAFMCFGLLSLQLRFEFFPAQVRLSVVELYNEELSDLIAAADDESAGKLRKLRLLEDPKKGIVLQVCT